MRLRCLPFFVAIFLLSVEGVLAQVYRYAPTQGLTSTALGFGTETGRHNQTLYRPNRIVDSTVAPFQVNKIYFRHGDTFQNTDVALDSLTLRLGTTRLYNLERNASFQTVFLTNIPRIFYRGRIVLPGGAQGNWFSLMLDTTITLDPAFPLVLDISFKASSNPAYSLQAQGVFLVPSPNLRASSASNTATSTTSTSGLIPHFGVDVVTALAPQKTLALAAYPNPATASVTLSLPNPTTATATLLHTDGRQTALGTQSGWDAWALPAGMAAGLYVISVQQGGVYYTAKLRIQ